MTDATQKGVSDQPTDETGDAKTPEPSARELAIEAIAVHRESTDVPEVDQLQAQLDDSPRLLSDGLDKMLVKVKIDGVEREVTVDEMQRQFQKNGAAERRLEEATRLLNEARQAKPPATLDAPSAGVDSTPTPEGGDEEGKAFLAALFDGDEEKALAALKKFGIGWQQPTQTESELVAQLTPQVKQQLVVENALERFAVDYADIVGDPHLASLADTYLEADVAAGMPFTEALVVAGQKTRDWLVSKGVNPIEPTPTMDRNTKLERKARIDKIPALNTKTTTVEEPVQSATDVIREMRKARGLEV